MNTVLDVGSIPELSVTRRSIPVSSPVQLSSNGQVVLTSAPDVLSGSPRLRFCRERGSVRSTPQLRSL